MIPVCHAIPPQVNGVAAVRCRPISKARRTVSNGLPRITQESDGLPGDTQLRAGARCLGLTAFCSPTDRHRGPPRRSACYSDLQSPSPRCQPALPPFLGVGPAGDLHLEPGARDATAVRARLVRGAEGVVASLEGGGSLRRPSEVPRRLQGCAPHAPHRRKCDRDLRHVPRWHR